MVQIYGILDPRDGSLRYVGKANNARKRFAGHMRERRHRTPLYNWFAKMRLAGLTPTYIVLLECDADAWQAQEIKCIAAARTRGERLLNVAPGGDQPECPIEVRRANANNLNQARRDDPIAARLWYIKKTLSNALRDGLLSDRAKANMRMAAQKRPDLFGAWSAV